MCLTIPAKVIKIKNNKAIIRSGDSEKEIDISLVKNLKIGDWVLHTVGTVIKRISQQDAQEIIDLLESHINIKISRLQPRFRKILKKARLGRLTKAEIVYLLKISDPIEKEALFAEANTVRQAYLKDFFCIHGIIEFSNYCKNDCFYCGLRRENQNISRYRMTIDEIVTTADEAVNKKGYKLLVFQSGDDRFYDDDALVEMITKIKKRCRVFIFMSVGERGYRVYQRMKKAGADGTLFRFETSNPKLYKALHPSQSFRSRIEHLKWMRQLGYFIASGGLIGLPGQTVEDLANDILLMKKIGENMVSMGPFVPCDNTPLVKEPCGDKEMNLKMIAVSRLLMPKVKIPVVTALETLDPGQGRRRALQAGANSLMFNLTPSKYRPYYKIYPNKFFDNEKMWEKYGLFKEELSYKMLEKRMTTELEKDKSRK
jgi:biotin synthase